jgi:hypothetical protein
MSYNLNTHPRRIKVNQHFEESQNPQSTYSFTLKMRVPEAFETFIII